MSNDTTLRQIQSGRTVPLAIEFHLIRYNTVFSSCSHRPFDIHEHNI
jgi:hypothetical protein